MQIIFSIEDNLLEKAKNIARHRKNTLGLVLNEALCLGLIRSSERLSAKLNSLLKTFRSDGLQADFGLLNSSELFHRRGSS